MPRYRSRVRYPPAAPEYTECRNGRGHADPARTVAGRTTRGKTVLDPAGHPAPSDSAFRSIFCGRISRRDGRVVECTALERRRAFTGPAGSNPAPSAKHVESCQRSIGVPPRRGRCRHLALGRINRGQAFCEEKEMRVSSWRPLSLGEAPANFHSSRAGGRVVECTGFENRRT